MMNLARTSKDWIRFGWFFTGRLISKTGFWRNTGISEKTGYKRKKKLIDIGLRMSFGGYWKLFMDGNSLDIGLRRLLIPVNQLIPNV